MNTEGSNDHLKSLILQLFINRQHQFTSARVHCSTNLLKYDMINGNERLFFQRFLNERKIYFIKMPTCVGKLFRKKRKLHSIKLINSMKHLMQHVFKQQQQQKKNNNKK